jgi:hypothetical protein
MSDKYDIEYLVVVRVEYSVEPRDPGAGFPDTDITIERVLMYDQEIELTNELKDAIRRDIKHIIEEEEEEDY